MFAKAVDVFHNFFKAANSRLAFYMVLQAAGAAQVCPQHKYRCMFDGAEASTTHRLKRAHTTQLVKEVNQRSISSGIVDVIMFQGLY